MSVMTNDVLEVLYNLPWSIQDDLPPEAILNKIFVYHSPSFIFSDNYRLPVFTYRFDSK